MSATTNRQSKDVVIHPIVVAEGKFPDVERQIFAADLAERGTRPLGVIRNGAAQ
jgi:hypothetical protein